MYELGQTLLELVVVLWNLLVQLILLGLQYLLLVGYIAVTLLAINWKRTWPILAQGAWAPLVLIILISAQAWTFLEPSYGYWWHLGGVVLLVGGAMFNGWLQGILGWTPADLNFDPPESEEGFLAHH